MTIIDGLKVIGEHGRTQTLQRTEAVIDSAVLVWMQMGLTNAQIMYGLASINVESGFFPNITNNLPNSTIRGLGQITDGTWHGAAETLDAAFNLAPDDNAYATPQPANIKNSGPFFVGNSTGTNAQSGESNDPAIGGAGIYDPQGLVTQLEVEGQLILNEWTAVNANELKATYTLTLNHPSLLSLFHVLVDSNGNPLPVASQPAATIAALAYLNHHEGSGWWNSTHIGNSTHIAKTTRELLNVVPQVKGDQDLGTPTKEIVAGFNQLSGFQQSLGAGHGTATDFLQGDPWTLSGAVPSFSDPDPSEIVISHNIPSMFPTLDNGLSQTLGGLSSFVANQAGYIQSPTGLIPTHIETYTYTNNATGPEDVVSGTATYNFTTLSGSGTETLGDQSTWTYNYTNLPSHFTETATETSQSGAVISQMTETKTTLNGLEINSVVNSDGVAATGGQLDYITDSNQSEVAAFYDNEGLLIEVSVSSAAGTNATTVAPLTSDPGYASWAQNAAQTFDVPLVDPELQSTPPTSISTVSNQATVTTSSTTSATSGTSSLDPGFQESAALASGATLSWSMNVDGAIQSRESYNQNGNFTSELFDSSGQLTGTSVTTTGSDGETVTTQLYNLQGATTGYSTVTTYAAGTSVAINGTTTVYANGCVITTQYEVASDGSMGAATGFSVSSTVPKAGGGYTTTEQNYQANYSDGAFVSDTLLGSTVTMANGDTGTSTDYDASGAVIDSRTLTTDGNGNTTIENLNATGAVTGSSTMSIDAQGNVTLDSYASDGTLTDTRTLDADGVLTDTQFQGGTVSGVATYSETFDGGNLTTDANASGTITGDQWEHADGSYGADTISAGGAIVGTAHYTDGGSSGSVDNGQGDITTTTINAAGASTGTTTTTIAAGAVTSQFVSTADTVSSEATTTASGAIQATTLGSSGNSVGIADDASDDISWISDSASGGSTSQLIDSSGDFLGTAVTTVATGGSMTVTNFDATGAETGYSVTSTVDGVVTTTNYADSAGTFSESAYSQTVVNASGSTTTDYTLETGVAVETGYAVSVTAANGDTTTTDYTLNSDGSGRFVVSGLTEVGADSQGNVTKQEFNSSGGLSGYTEERIDSSGDTLITSYDSTGDLLSSSTVYASAIVNNVLYETDSGTVSTTWQTNGTYQQTTDDGEGDVTTTSYAANGTALGDTWTQNDGSLGQDTFNADGSELSVSNDGLGDLTTTTVAASGATNSVVDYYDNGSPTATVDNHDSSWALRGSVQVSTTSDGSETDTSYYDASNNLVVSNSVTTSTDGLTVTGSYYDTQGLLGSRSEVTSADGLTVTTTAMDGGGNTLGTRVVTTSADGTSTSTTCYNASGDLLGVTTNVVSTDGLTTTTSNYGPANNLLNYSTAVTSSDGLTVTTSNYNAANQLQGDSVVVTSSDGSTVTTSNYDGSDNLLGYQTVMTSADGQTTTTSDYSASGQLLDSNIAAPSSDGLGVTTTYLNGQGETLSSDTAYTSSDGTSVLAKSFDAEGQETGYSIADTGEDGSVTTVNYSLSATGVATYAGSTVVFDPRTSVVPAWGNGEIYTAGAVGTLIDAVGTNDLVYGESGNDTLVALGAGTTLVRGTASDVFEVNDPTDVVIGSGTGNDTLLSSVSYTLPFDVDILTLTGSANLTAHGNFDAANLITGNAGNDTLFAGSGADTLVSGSGVDTLEGGAGKDTFVVNNSADVIDVNYYGSDTVESSVSYVLNAPVYTMNLTGSANISATDDFGYATMTGNAGNDTLIGGYGNDELIAGTGIDTFVAGSGSTTFVLNSAADVIQGLTASDRDTVESSASYSLASGADTLIFTGTGNVSGDGNNDASNSITGNAGNDTLAAGSGSDSLYAGTGVDTLIAGTGSDSLFGNAGDTYVLNSGFGNVEINQASGAGTLQFGAGITAADLQLSLTTGSDGIPALLIHDGSSAVTVDGGLNGSIGSFDFADGSDLSLGRLASEATVIPSTIASGTSNIILDGASGDSINGGIGNDTIYALGANDTLVAGSGNQELYGFGANDLLIGSTGDDGLHGGSGNDTLVAGPGNSVLYGGSATDSYILTEGGTSTLVPSSVAGQAQIIYLPQGMTLSDFTSYPDASGDLILQSLSGDTTAIVKGFYDGGSANKAWLIASDTDAPQFLGHWAGTDQETGSAYAQEIDGLKQAYEAQIGVTLNQLGEDGGILSEGGYSNGTPQGPSYPPYYFYQFNGVTEQSVTVSGGSYNAGSTESDQIQTTYYTQQATQTISTPIYSTITTPEEIAFVPVGDTPADQLNDENNNVQTATVDGQLGEYVDIPSEVHTSITGYRTTTETIEENTSTVNLTRAFNITNITGDGGNDVITAAPQYVGTVDTGDGNVSVNLGYYDGVMGHTYNENNGSNPGDLPPPGAFIQAGSGNDTLTGTGGEDTIAAGTGFDYMEGGLGTTYYVPMVGDSTAEIGDPGTPYGDGPFAPTTLVLPSGITPNNLTYRVFEDAATGSDVLQLRNGNSSVLVYFSPDPNNNGNFNVKVTNGVNLFQFADGTVLTRAQLLAQATLLPNDFNPQVSVDSQNLTAGEEVSANGFFSATDSSDDPITWYRVTNSGEGGAYFTLDGKTQETGQPFYVSAGQLSQLTYVAGAADSTDSIQVSAFDGAIWSASQSLTISPTGSSTNTFSATGADQLVTGATTAPDTLAGGYAGDTLVGGSGQDTFLYAAGSGAETISESAPITSSSNNTLQFGSGITPGMVSLAVTGSDLQLQIGSNGDSIQIAGFNLTDPLNSIAIQNFSFSNGTSLSLAELLAQAPAASGTINNSDGSATTYTINPTGTQPYTAETVTGPGDPLSQYTLNSDGSTEADTWTWAQDGSFVYTEISTPGDTWAGTKLVQDYNADNQAQSQVITLSDGTTETFAWTYATDGSITQTEVTTPGDGSPSSETIQDYNASGQLVTQLQDNADGSTDADTYTYGSDGSIVVTDVHAPAGGGASNTVTQDFNPQGQIVGQQNLNTDGSTDDTVWTYNSNGSYSESDVHTSASGGGEPTTTVQTYNSDNQFTGQNGYAPQSDGSYTDVWYKTDGSQGVYWWNASTLEYQESWQNADGSTFTDDYQYAAGGSPGSTNVSFTETYSDSSGDEGTRQYNATTGVTTVTWDSPQTGSISGTTTNDSGFIGLQLQGELTNTVNDPSYFNPATSPVFTSFLAAHG